MIMAASGRPGRPGRAAGSRGGGEHMAGIITISKGHDASYPWRQIGTAEPAAGTKPADKGVGYYLSPAEKGGEPPGTWTGRGVAELGLQPGGIVKREVFERLYGHHLDPRDPAGQTRLGRATQPVPLGRGHLRRAARRRAGGNRRAPRPVTDRGQSPGPYTRPVLGRHVQRVEVHLPVPRQRPGQRSCGSPARRPGERGGLAVRSPTASGTPIMEGNVAALDYLQREAGQTRAGYHPGGRWEDAREWVIASFRQHTSRDGDPQLHVHNLILHKVLRESDGQWRALDSMSLYRHRPAASAIAALATENALTRKYGIRWVQRKDGHGREIAGVEQALMDTFSSRRQSIGPLTARLAQEYEAQFGRAPDARALTSLRQWANHATRRGKDTGALDLAALVRQWSAQARASEAGALEPLAPKVMGTPKPTTPAEPADHPEPAQAHPAPLTDAQAHRIVQEAVAAVQAAQSTWTEADLIRHIGERLPAPARRDDRAAGRRPAPCPGPPGPGHRGGHAVRAGMAPRPRQPAPRVRRKPLHPARRSPLRHQRPAHPRRPPPRPRARTRRPAP